MQYSLFSGLKSPVFTTVLLLLVFVSCAPLAVAKKRTPEYWNIEADEPIIMRTQPARNSPALTTIPQSAKRLKNKGCQGGVSAAKRAKMTPAQIKKLKNKTWCRITYSARRGWVQQQYLKAAKAPAPITSEEQDN